MRRSILVVALVWLATVAGVSSLTWSIISAAGLHVGTQIVVAGDDTSKPSPAQSPSASAHSLPSPSASTPPPTSPAAHPTTKPTTRPSSRPSQSATAKPSSSAPAQTWTGTVGRVTVRCSGDSISLVAAVPAVGYHVEVTDRGPQRVSLEFEASESESETGLVATCANGTAHFRLE